jgi:hypothetical protein
MDFASYMKNQCNILVGKHEKERRLERPRCRWKIILKYILKGESVEMWAGCIWLTIGLTVKLFKQRNKHSVSIKGLKI